MTQYTPTEVLLLRVLNDGRPHQRSELLAALPDDLSGKNGLATHLSRMRVKMRPIGQDIICELSQRKICYRWVRLLSIS